MALRDPAGFGVLLRRHRLVAGLTQDALARQAGLSVRGIADLERGARRSPYPATVQRLADALQLDRTQRASLATAARPSAMTQRRWGASGATSRHNLPAAITSFIGRERELAEVQARIVDARLLTLTGVGGCGKTRLALEVADAVLARYADGVWLVELASLADPALVAQSVGAVVGVRESAGQSIVSALVARLRERRMLLVLDNCEHLLDGCARTVDAILRGCPGVYVLATSREALGLNGEVAWRVPSLPVPDPRHLPRLPELRQNAAVQLFVERAAAAQPHFVLTEHNAPAVAQICQQLDGIPLALELGAARMEGLTADQLASRLDEGFRLLTGGSRAALPRQQTLRATLDWSYNLLTDLERSLFNRLSVFAGGWSVQAAEAVCSGGGIQHEDVLELLLQLVRKSLVVAYEGTDGAERYRLLETLRQFARERLSADGELEGLRQQHASYFLAFNEALHPDRVASARWFRWPQPNAGQLDQLEREHDNMRAALRSLIESGKPEQALELAEVLFQIGDIRGSLSEAEAWLQELLSLPSVAERPAVRERILPLLGELASRHGDYATAIAAFNESLAAYRSTGDEVSIANALCALASVHFDLGEYGVARSYLDESLSIAAGVRDVRKRNWWYVSGGIALHEERLDEARALFHEALAAAGSQLGGYCQKDLGWVALQQGAYDEARTQMELALQAGEELNDRNLLAYSIEAFSCLAAALGQHERAVCLSSAAAALREARGSVLPPSAQRMVRRWLDASNAALTEAAAAAAWKLGHTMPLEEAITYARKPVAAMAAGVSAPDKSAAVSAEDPLTRREREVAALVAHGLSNGQIAEQLVISQRTVAAHIEHILNKLGFVSRTQVGVWAAEHQRLAPSLT